jgi:hypothetical protein
MNVFIFENASDAFFNTDLNIFYYKESPKYSGMVRINSEIKLTYKINKKSGDLILGYILNTDNIWNISRVELVKIDNGKATILYNKNRPSLNTVLEFPTGVSLHINSELYIDVTAISKVDLNNVIKLIHVFQGGPT